MRGLLLVALFAAPVALAGCLGDPPSRVPEDEYGVVVEFAAWRRHDPVSDPFYPRGETFYALVVNRAPVPLTGQPHYWIYNEAGDVVKRDRYLGARTELEPDQGFLVSWDFRTERGDAPEGAYVVIGEFAGYQDRVRIVLRNA